MMTPVHPIRQQPRFAGNTPADRRVHAQGMDRLRQSLSQAGDLLDVYYVKANEKAPQTPLRKARKQLYNGIRTAVLVTLLAIPGAFGVQGIRNAANNQPTATTVQQHHALKGAWNDLVIASRTNNPQDGLSQVDFNWQSRNFMLRVLEVGQAHPTEAADVALAAKIAASLRQTGQDEPIVTAHRLGLDLIKYIEEDLRLPSDPSDRELNAAFANFRRDFIRQTPQLQHLDATQQEQLTRAVVNIVRAALPGQIQLNAFDNLMLGYIGGIGFEGVTLEQFANLKNEEDAKRLFTAAVTNPKNFALLNDSERRAFLEYGLSVVDSLEYPQDSYLPWALLMLVGLGGAAALGFLRRQDLSGLRGATSAIAEALKAPALIITNEDRGNREGQRKLVRLNDRIDQDAGEMALTLRSAMRSNPAVRDFLLELFRGEDKLPDA